MPSAEIKTTWTTDANDVEWINDENGNRTEKWLPVAGHAGRYEVSNLGRVRSLDRENINRLGVVRRLRGKVLRLSQDGEGYAQVGLLCDGVETKVRVHRLVAATFIINPTNLPLVDHRNRKRVDNEVANLRWATFADNRRNVERITLADMKKLAESSISSRREGV